MASAKVVVIDRRKFSKELDSAYRLLGVRSDCHPLVLAKARTALLVLSASAARDAKIEWAYATIRRHRLLRKDL